MLGRGLCECPFRTQTVSKAALLPTYSTNISLALVFTGCALGRPGVLSDAAAAAGRRHSRQWAHSPGEGSTVLVYTKLSCIGYSFMCRQTVEHLLLAA
eukprot:5117425-Pyramimonas_sp.AAC.1